MTEFDDKPRSVAEVAYLRKAAKNGRFLSWEQARKEVHKKARIANALKENLHSEDIDRIVAGDPLSNAKNN